jgi:hypothetical protein
MSRHQTRFKKFVCSWATFCMVVQPVLVQAQTNTLRVPLGVVQTGSAGGGQLTYSDSSIDFGPVLVNGTAGHGLTITNSGTASVTLNSISETGPGFSHTSNCSDYLAPGASCNVDVTFAPTVSGSASGTLTVNSDDSDPNHAISLTGRGKAGTLSGPGYQFPDPRQVGDTLIFHDITVSNISPAPVVVSGVSVSQGAQSFSQSNNCLRTLGQGESCTVRVGFSPSAPGTLNGVVSVVSDSDESPLNVAVQGEGRSPSGTLTAQSFGAVQVGDTVSRAVTLANTGVGPLTISSKGVTGTDYRVGAAGTDTCGASLAVGASCSFPVDFTPSVTGARPGAASATTGAGSLNVNFDGAGASQAATLSDIAFGKQDVGQGADKTATLVNTGIGALTLTVPSASSVTGNNFTFVSTTCGTSLAKGDQCTVTVHYAPSAPADDLGSLKIATGAGTLAASLSGTGQQAVLGFAPASLPAFDKVQVGQTADSEQVTLTNSGNVAAAALSLSAPAGFSVTASTCGTTLAAGSSCAFKVRFAPTAAQAYSGTLKASADAPSSPASLNLAGTGAAQAASLTSIVFGSRAAGSTTDLTATLSNTGVGPLAVTAPTASSVTGTGFTFVSSNCPASVAVNGSCTVTVRFAPTDGSTYSGTLSVDTGGGNKSVGLSGQGLQGVAATNPSSLAFAPLQVGDTSAARTVTLTNNGNTTLAVSGISIADGATDFAQSNDCAAIPAGGHCTINVNFTPSAAGSRTGSLAILHDGAGVTTVTLSGTGAAQAATLSAPSFAATAVGASSTATATLTNTGIGALAVTAPTTSSVTGTDFSFVSTTCGASVAAGASCTTTVKFSPTSTAARTGTLSIGTGAGNQNANLSATGQQAILSFAPATLPAFGNVQVGQSTDSATVTLTNSGNITAASLTLSPPSGYSLVGSTCGTSLAASASCSFKVRFAPSAVQTYSGNLTATADAPSTSATLAVSGAGVAQSATLSTPSFAATAVGASSTATATLTNTGVGPLSVTTPTAASVTGSDFALASTTCGTSLAAGNSCSVTLTFAPAAMGTRTGSLVIGTGAGSQSAALSGTGQQAILAISPTSTAAFGNVQVGQTADSALMTLSNSGNVAATSLAFAMPAGYSLSGSTCGTSVAAGGNCSITVRFAPTAAQSYTGNLTVSAAAPSTTATRALSGTGVAQSASLSTPSFPATAVGASSTGTATLTNTGVGPLSVTTPAASSVAGTDFSFVSTTCASSLAVGASCSTTVKFSPTSTTARNGTLTIATGAGNQVVSLGSTGIQGYATISPGSLTFSAYQVGTTAPVQTVTVTNTGTNTLTFTGVSVSAGAADFAQSNNCGSVPVNGTCTVNVSFTPSAAGSRTGTLSFAHDGGGVANVSLSGTGQAQSATLSTPSFASTAVGASTTGTATLSNTGIGALAVTVPTASSVTGTDFSFVSTTCTSSVAVSGSCTVTVKFSPTSTAARTGTLTVSTGAGNQNANLSATGQQAILAFSPASVPAFGNVQVGQTADSAVITVTNSGNVAATSLAITPPSGYSLVGSTCGTSLAAGSTCSFTVRFAPTAAQGYTGNLTVAAAAPSTGASLALSGTGVSQSATLSTPSFTATAVGASSTATATLTNTGVGPLSVTTPAASSVAGTDYAFSSTTCGTSVAAGSSCTVTVQFAPSAVGTRTGTLTVATGAGSQVVNLSGTAQQAVLAFSPTTLPAFGNVQVGQTADSAVVTLTNSGNVAASSLVVGTPAGYSLVGSTCTTSLAVGASCSFTVRFAPTAAQAYAGNLTASAAAPSSAAALALSGTGVAQSATLSTPSFAATAVGSSNTATATLSNTGVGPLSVTVPSAASVTGTDFSFVSTTCGTSVAASGTCTVTVKFSPTSTAARTGTLTVATGAGNQTASLSATGQQAILAFSPTTVPAFGNVQVGQTADSATVTLTNSGNVTASSLVLGTPAGYSLVGSTCTTSLAVGASCSFVVRFAPTAAQAYAGNLTASAAAPSAATSLALSGTGVAQSATLSAVSFPATAVGASTTGTATLSNTGVGPLSVTAPTSASVVGTDFSFVSTTCGTSVAAGGSCTVTVQFAPTAGVARTGTLTVSTGAGNQTANLSGTGQQAVLAFSPATLTGFGNVQVGQTADSATVTLTNSGNIAASTLTLSPPAGYSLVGSTCATSLAAGASCSFTVRFAPTAAQAYTGNLAATASAPSTSASLALSGTGVAQAATLSSPSFPATAVGASSTGTATLSNTGVGPLSVTAPTSASVVGTDFSFVSTTCGTSLAAGGTCTVTVKFSPTSTTARTGTLTVATGAGSKTASLGSTGIQGYASISPGSLTFTTYQIGTTAPVQTVTVTNTGTNTLTFTGVSISAGSTDFAQSNNCGAVPVNGTCTVNVSFTPSSAGARSGTLSFAHDGGGVANVSLSGTGQAQSATLSTPAIATTAVGASTTATATLTNTGIGPLAVTVPTASAVTGTDYAFVSTTCGTSVAAGGTCAVTVQFAPTAAGTRTGTLTVSTGAGNQNATLSATGQQAVLAFSPTTLASFGNVQVGQTVDSALVTLTNSGNVAASALTVGTPAGYSLVGSTCTTSLAAGSSCSFTVRFAPTAAQAYTGNLTASATAPATAPTLALSGTGVSQSGTLSTPSFATTSVGASNTATATLTNTGVGPLTVTVPTASSVTGTDFSFVSTTCGASVAAGGTCTVTVKFSPTSTTARTGTLTVATGAGNLTANLAATGQQATLAFSPATLASFGNVQVGQTADSALVTLTNSGNVAASSLVLSTPAGYSLVGSTCTTSLAAGASCSFTVRFAPTAAQAYSGNLGASATAPATAPTLALSGTGVSQSASLSAPSFAATAVGTSTTATATLTNTGIGPLSVTVPAASAVTGTDYAFSSTTCTTSLAAGSTCTVTVKFAPTAAGTRTGTLTVATGAGNQTANLSATGQQAVLAFSPTTLASFGNVQVGQTADSALVTLTNSGNVAASTLAVTPPTGYSLVGSTCTTSLAAGASCSFTVRFAPTAAQAYTGNLAATAAAPATAPTLAMSGTGVAQAATLTTPSFPTTAVGGSNTAAATLTNTGVGPLSVTVPTASSVTGTDFSFVSTTCGTSVAAGGTCTVTVKFSPTSTTARTGTLTVVTGAGNQTANLGSTGIQGYASISPGSLTFSAYQVGTTAPVQTVTVTNTGTNTLTFTGVSISAGGSDFAQSNNCGAVPVNGTCTVNVNFTPSAAGARSGTLSFAHDGGGVANVSLSGTGQAQSGTLSTPSFATTATGSSTTGTATLSNTGIGALSVTVPTASSVTGTDYAFVSTTCGSSLAVSTSCTVTVKFAPTAAGTRTGTLTVATGAGSLAANLSATGQQGNASVSPASLSFATQTLSTTSATQTVTVTNNGTATLTISGVSVSAGATDFGQSNTCGSPLAVNGTCTISVAFTPSAAGARSGTLTLNHNGTGTTSVALSGTGASAPSVTSASFSPATVTTGASSTFSWATSNATSASVSCSGTATGSGSGTSGSITVSTAGTGTGTCTVTATNAAGTSTSASGTLSVVAAPSVTSASFSPTSVTSGGSSTFSWATSNATSASVSCSAPASGSGSGTSGSITVTTSGSGTGYCTVTAYNAAGSSASGSASLSVVIPPPTVTQASFSSRTLTSGYSTTFSWATSGATSASVSCSGTASGSGSGTSGSITVTASGSGTGTCTVTASNAGGSRTGSDSFTSVYAPSASSYFGSSTIGAGSYNTYYWSTSNATSASVSCSGIASGSSSGTSGSVSVYASGAGTGYCTVTAYNAAGQSSSNTSSFSAVNKPTASGSFSNYSPVQGSTVTFSWSTSGATTSTNVDCWGAASGTYRGSAASGSISVSVTGTGSGSCNVAAINPAGETDGTATFTASAPPAPSVTSAYFSPTSVTEGSSSTFSWATSNATSASVSCSAPAYGSGSGTSGSISVSTSGSGTGYCTVSASGAGGSASGSGSLTVNPAITGVFSISPGSHSSRGSSGDTITFYVSNAGSGTITNISASCSGGSFYMYGNGISSLAPGQSGSWTCKAAASGWYNAVTLTISGTNANTASASG